jgi:hypothetical protein
MEAEVDEAIKKKKVSNLKCVKDCKQSDRHFPKKNEQFVLCARVPKLSKLVVMVPTPKGIDYLITKTSNVSDLLELKLKDPDERRCGRRTRSPTDASNSIGSKMAPTSTGVRRT